MKTFETVPSPLPFSAPKGLVDRPVFRYGDIGACGDLVYNSGDLSGVASGPRLTMRRRVGLFYFCPKIRDWVSVDTVTLGPVYADGYDGSPTPGRDLYRAFASNDVVIGIPGDGYLIGARMEYDAGYPDGNPRPTNSMVSVTRVRVPSNETTQHYLMIPDIVNSSDPGSGQMWKTASFIFEPAVEVFHYDQLQCAETPADALQTWYSSPYPSLAFFFKWRLVSDGKAAIES